MESFAPPHVDGKSRRRHRPSTSSRTWKIPRSRGRDAEPAAARLGAPGLAPRFAPCLPGGAGIPAPRGAGRGERSSRRPHPNRQDHGRADRHPRKRPFVPGDFFGCGAPPAACGRWQRAGAAATGRSSSWSGNCAKQRDRLQVTVEEYEASLEEMKSGNEEMVSVNGELQSTNEELKTSKEELQSVNEELQTVNSELNSKVEELDRANADLRNLFETTQVETIFLDNELVIRSFTPAATSVFNLIRPTGDARSPISSAVSTTTGSSARLVGAGARRDHRAPCASIRRKDALSDAHPALSRAEQCDRGRRRHLLRRDQAGGGRGAAAHADGSSTIGSGTC